MQLLQNPASRHEAKQQNPPPWRYAPGRPATFHPLVSDASGRPTPDCSPNCKDFLKNWFTDWNTELYRIVLSYYYLKHYTKCTIYLCMIEKVAILQIFENTVGPRCCGSCQDQTVTLLEMWMNSEDFRGTPSSHDLHRHVLRQKQLWYHSDFQEIPASCCSLRCKTRLRFNKEEVSQGAGQKSSG